MLRTLLDTRTLLAMAVALAVGVWGLRTYPLPADNVFLALIALRRPDLHQGLQYAYATLWFTTPFFGASLLGSLFAIAMYRHAPRLTFRSLPRYVPPEERPAPSLVLGEAHHETRPGRAPDPQWLTIPQRGLYTGVMVLGSVGTGKTSACMYPYVDQLVRWRSHDADHKLGGLVMEVKGDFCRQVQAMLRACGREADYVEVGLDTDVCYNPLHNDLDPYAVAYAIATLLNNLFGKSKEPFWQQAYTDLLKFVILLRRLTDGYTTFAEVYRYILDDQLIDRDIRKLKATLASPPDVILLQAIEYDLHDTSRGWSHWYEEDADHMAHPYDSELETHLAARASRTRCVARRARAGPRAVTSSRRSSAGTCTAGVGSTRASAPRSPRASSCSSRCSTTTPPCTARSVRRAVPTSGPARPATRGPSTRSTRCSTPAASWP